MTVHAYTQTVTKIDEYELNKVIDERVNAKLEPLVAELVTLTNLVQDRLAAPKAAGVELKTPLYADDSLSDLSDADTTREYTDKDGDTWRYDTDPAGDTGWIYSTYANDGDEVDWAGPFKLVPRAGDLYRDAANVPVGTRVGIWKDGKRSNDLGVWKRFRSGGEFKYAHGEDAEPLSSSYSHWTASDVNNYAPLVVL